MSLIEIFTIIIVHWIADFVLQTDKQAKGKSKNWDDLISHTTLYSMIWGLPIYTLLSLNSNSWNTESNAVLFMIMTFIAHTITDYFTSRLNSKLWEKGEVHNFFVSVGFDQVLHYLQLFSTYYLLIKF